MLACSVERQAGFVTAGMLRRDKRGERITRRNRGSRLARVSRAFERYNYPGARARPLAPAILASSGCSRDDAGRSGQPERNRDERDGCDVRDNRPLWDDSLGG